MSNKTILMEATVKKEGATVEREYVRVILQAPGFNPQTGKPVSKPYEQAFGVKEWSLFLKAPNGLVVKRYINLPKGCKKLEAYQKEVKDKELKRIALAEGANAKTGRK